MSGGDYAGKPRPALVIQADMFEASTLVTICPFTTDERGPEAARVVVKPSQRNGLQAPSHIMADKITTLPKNRLGKRVGVVGADDLKRVETAIMIFLGLG